MAVALALLISRELPDWAVRIPCLAVLSCREGMAENFKLVSTPMYVVLFLRRQQQLLRAELCFSSESGVTTLVRFASMPFAVSGYLFLFICFLLLFFYYFFSFLYY